MTLRVLRALSLFGSVESLTIICNLIRTKLLSLWVGPLGVGLLAILGSALDLLSTISSLGIRQSAVNDIASPRALPDVPSLVTRLTRWLALLGAALTILLAWPLSLATWGDTSHAWLFVILAVAVAASVITQGARAVMQGLGTLRLLAATSVWGVAIGLLVSIPLFRFFGIHGVLPSVIAVTLATAVAASIGSRRAQLSTPHSSLPTPDSSLPTPHSSLLTPNSQLLPRARHLLRLGAWLTLSSAVTLLSSYLVTVIVNRLASTSGVGIFQAGYTLVDRYGGVIFTAIAMEFYPRLVANIHSPRRTGLILNHEISLLLAILLPAIPVFLLLLPYILPLLFSSQFLPALPYASWALPGMLFRAASWCIGFLIIARADGRLYLWVELSSSILYVLLSVSGYLIDGFRGMGIAYSLWYLIYFIITAAISRFHYRLPLSPRVTTLMLFSFAAWALTLLASSLL